ncbi:MAG: hypothetical protein OXP66_12920 [Candidatus Tectomicrobia bacterium]|nr:hypothetical protein [Candidatus Tectomicrobia bacterium]
MRRKALWVLLGVFILGAGTGVFVDRACMKFGWWGHEGRGDGWEGSLEKRQARIVNFMVHKLELSDDQRAEIEPILRKTWDDISTLGLGFIERMEQVLQHNADRIRVHLHPEQTEKFDRIVERFRNKSSHWRQRLGQTPPSP